MRVDAAEKTLAQLSSRTRALEKRTEEIGVELEAIPALQQLLAAQDARIKFRRRKPKLGGADEALLGVGGSEWPPLEHTRDAPPLLACLRAC